jgi:hypothetical protein
MGGGQGWEGRFTSVADIRKYAASLKTIKPKPTWIFNLCDYLEGEPSKTAEFIDSKVRECICSLSY